MLIHLVSLRDLLRTQRELDNALVEPGLESRPLRRLQRINDATLRELDRVSDRLEGRDAPLLLLQEKEGSPCA